MVNRAECLHTGQSPPRLLAALPHVQGGRQGCRAHCCRQGPRMSNKRPVGAVPHASCPASRRRRQCNHAHAGASASAPDLPAEVKGGGFMVTTNRRKVGLMACLGLGCKMRCGTAPTRAAALEQQAQHARARLSARSWLHHVLIQQRCKTQRPCWHACGMTIAPRRCGRRQPSRVRSTALTAHAHPFSGVPPSLTIKHENDSP